MRFGIGMKLTAALMLMVGITCLSGWWSLRTLDAVRADYEQLVQEVYPLALTAQNLNTEVQIQAQHTIAYAVTREQGAITRIKDAREKVAQHTLLLEQAAQEKPELAKMVTEVSELRTRFDRMVDGVLTAGNDLAQDQLALRAESARRTGEQMGVAVEELIKFLRADVATAARTANTAAQRANMVQLIMLAVSIGCGVLISFLVIRFIARPVRDVAIQLEKIAQGAGDLRHRIDIRTKDELGLLAQSFNQLVQGLAGTVHQVIRASEELNDRALQLQETTGGAVTAATQVSAGAQTVAEGAQTQAVNAASARHTMTELAEAISQIASGAHQQSAQVQQTAETVHHMVQAIQAVAERAAGVSQATRAASESAHRGAKIVDQTLGGMDDVRVKVLDSAVKVQELGRNSGRIGEMLQVITEIAEQTNLLALNAAIEAARAGQFGRGFAVVAEEVRKLAERSGEATKEIRTLVRNIQMGTEDAVAAIAETTRGVEAGANLTNQAGQALREILAAVEQTVGAVEHISQQAHQVMNSTKNVAASVNDVAAITEENSAATEEMAAGAEQVSAAISQVHSISETNGASLQMVSASMSEVYDSITRVAAAADELSNIAGRLQSLVGQFKV